MKFEKAVVTRINVEEEDIITASGNDNGCSTSASKLKEALGLPRTIEIDCNPLSIFGGGGGSGSSSHSCILSSKWI